LGGKAPRIPKTSKEIFAKGKKEKKTTEHRNGGLLGTDWTGGGGQPTRGRLWEKQSKPGKIPKKGCVSLIQQEGGTIRKKKKG